MNQAFLPGIRPTEEEMQKARLQQRQKQTYTCQRCHHLRPSVVWDVDTGQFICWACGRGDTRRTKQAREENNDK